MDNKQLAEKILQLVGGKDNVNSVTHCVTRLRIIVNDISFIKQKEFGKLDIIGINLVGTQFQVILGAKVIEVYDAFEALIDQNNSSKQVVESKKISSRIIDTFTGIFTPILPAIIGAGLLKGILIFLLFFGLAPTDSDLYRLLTIFSDAVYYFLPMLLAVSTATHFKCNKFVALAIAGVLIHPALIEMLKENQTICFLGLPITKANYSSSVLPIVLGVWLMSYVEKWLGKIVPSILRTILVPVLTILIVAPIMLVVVGPAGTIISNALASNFLSFYKEYGMIAGALFSGFLPLMILLGIHNGFTPVMVQSLASYGFEYLMGLNVASNSAQAGATFAVFTRTKNKDFKSLAGTAALNAIIGITEPALYGVTTKLKRPLIAVMIGGSIGGAIAGFFGVKAVGLGTGPIAGIPLFLTETFIYFVISCIVSFVVAFGLTLFLGFDDVTENEYKDENNNAVIDNLENERLYSPINGDVISLSQVKDTVFSSRMMGDGLAILPKDGNVYAPCDGIIETTVESGHAIGIKSDRGCEVLIHVGLDTVERKGEGFKYYVNMGDRVNKGDLLMTFDKNVLEEAGYDLTTPVLIVNTNLYTKIEGKVKGKCKAGTLLLEANQ